MLKDNNFTEGEAFPIVEDFYTIQGEGFHTGKPAYFIRIGGCDVCCSWCDVKVSWNPTIHPIGTVKQIVDKALSFPARAVVITGGEPLLYNLDVLCETLKLNKFEIFLETSGAHTLSGTWDWICLSPKKNSPPVEELFQKANELKVVIDSELDFSWAEYCKNNVSDTCKLYLQPEWGIYKTKLPIIIDYIKNNPRWSISLQTQKFMHIP
ncbi:MAG: 7-carboxy-7-deazaguanine synthase QueE [Bacteroidales bacterium]|nr:7-carboxy-7-deazaguanine synthase QueE [Bacteroidales bacterium]